MVLWPTGHAWVKVEVTGRPQLRLTFYFTAHLTSHFPLLDPERTDIWFD